MNNSLMIGFFLLFVFAACSKDKIMTFDPKGSIWFEKAQDTTRFSFAIYDDNTELAIVPVEVQLIGRLEDTDRQLSVEVVKQATNSQTKYEIVKPVILKANQTTTNIEIKVWKTPNLDIARDTITIKLADSGDLFANYEGHSTHTITFYNKFDKPDWWDQNAENFYIGKFNDLKMSIVLVVLGQGNPISNWNQWIYNQYLLTKYVKDNNITYPDGSPVIFNYNG